MVVRSRDRLTALYERDETAWLEVMAELIRDGRFGELDYENLGEYLADMARRDRREVESRLAVLIAHLLKWEHQPRRRSGAGGRRSKCSARNWSGCWKAGPCAS